MSTPRWKAKEVRKLAKNKQYNYTYSVFNWFETEDGRKFTWAKYNEWNKDTQFYIVKDIGEHRSVALRYWIYPVPQSQVIDTSYNRCRVTWFGGTRRVVVEMK